MLQENAGRAKARHLGRTPRVQSAGAALPLLRLQALLRAWTAPAALESGNCAKTHGRLGCAGFMPRGLGWRGLAERPWVGRRRWGSGRRVG